jgi:hypothetical protein
MVFSANWQCLARYSPKIAIGLGASAGMGYFMNRTYCDSPLAIGSIETVFGRYRRSLDDYDSKILFDKNMDGFTLVDVYDIPSFKGHHFKNTDPTVIRGLYFNSESLSKLLEECGYWEDPEDLKLYVLDYQDIPMKYVFKANREIAVSLPLYKIWETCYTFLEKGMNGDFGQKDIPEALSTSQLEYLKEASEAFEDFFWSIPDYQVKLKPGESLVITKEADKSITVDFPKSTSLSGLNIKNEMVCAMVFGLIDLRSSVTFKKPLNGEENSSD